ncbi:MAG: alpha-amylase family glycosyl hydrolase [Oscillospiraceae bacterium]|nr:alpha-amylase family glycosyl hydrolase [Oscillospiraceae bacterium]
MKKALAWLTLAAVVLTGCNQTVAAVNPTEYINEPYNYTQPLHVKQDLYRNFYAVTVPSFYDNDGDGVGDLQGIAWNMDYIANLNCNGLYISSVLSGADSLKNAVSDYYSIDPAFGTLEDMAFLLDECKMRAITLIMEMPLNHTSTQHTWFTLAVESLKAGDFDNQYVNYYNFTTESSKEGYYPVEGTAYYYQAINGSEKPDLNLNNETLRADLQDALQYWLERGVGGFCFTGVEDYFENDADATMQVLVWLVDFCKRIKPECYVAADANTDFNTTGSLYASGFDTIMNYGYAGETGRIVKTVNKTDPLGRYGEAMTYAQRVFAQYTADTVDGNFLSGQNVGRLYDWFAGDVSKIKLAIGLNAMLGGSNFLFYGEELGLSGAVNVNTAMDWAEVESLGETIVEGGNTVQPLGSAELQKADPGSIYNYTRLALRLRQENPEIARGVAKVATGIEDEDLSAVFKATDAGTLIVVINTAMETKTIQSPMTLFGATAMRGYLSPTGRSATFTQEELSIPPYGIVVLSAK